MNNQTKTGHECKQQLPLTEFTNGKNNCKACRKKLQKKTVRKCMRCKNIQNVSEFEGAGRTCRTSITLPKESSTYRND